MRMRIGEYLVAKGALTSRQVDEILAHSRATGKRFGDAGLELRILTEESMKKALGKSFRVDFFHVDPAYLSTEGQDLYTREQIVKFGMLPLGFRVEHKFFRSRRMLSVGFLDPARLDALDQADALARRKLGQAGIHGIRPWLIMPEHFWSTAEHLHRLTPEWVLSLSPKGLDPTLADYLRASQSSLAS